MKKQWIYIRIIILLLILGILTFVYLKNQDKIIGGERDKHGCLGPAGYSWNETEQECVREWLDGEERYQVNNFHICGQAGYPIMESYPRQCRTPSGKLFVEDLTVNP